MQAIAFCSRCRGMRVGWNGHYVRHCLICKDWISKSSKLLMLTVLLVVFIFAFPTPGAFVFSGDGIQQPIQKAGFEVPTVTVIDPAVSSIETLLKGYGVDESHRGRVALSVVRSARRHNLDPRLIASIVIVESRANPFAISSRDSIGIMQVHLPTWGRKADREGINLFKIEDNVDFGARILKDYVHQSGLWEGVKRYKGWFADNPQSESSAEEYVAKVQRIYGYQQPVASTADLLQ
jgi:soluble lytic murein transglycosylase-like protein